MNILIVKTSSLGDIIHTLPALTDAKNMIPDISFDWVVEESFAEIPLWHIAVQNVIPVAWRRWRKNIIKSILSGEILSFLKMLRKKKYDLIIDAQGLIKSSIISKMARGTCYGYAKNSAREKQASFLYNKTFTVAKDQHAITRTRQLFSTILKYALSATLPNYGIDMKIFPYPNSCEKYMVFFHGTSREKKCWDIQKWIDLAHIAISNDYMIYLPWGDEAELIRAKLISQYNKKIKILPKLDILAIAVLLRSSKGVVSVDTGLGHIAAALGINTISLYGPTNPKLSGTIGINQTHMINFDKLEAIDVWQQIQKAWYKYDTASKDTSN